MAVKISPQLLADYRAKNPHLFKPLSPCVTVPIPPRLSDLFGGTGNRRYVTKKYQAWRNAVDDVFATMLPVPQDQYPVEVRWVILPGKRWRTAADVANREKAITDAMVRAGVLVDDSQDYVVSLRMAVDQNAVDRRRETMVRVWWTHHEKWWE